MSGTGAQRIVVTGAAGGIGTSICQRLVQDGMSVEAFDIDAAALDRLVAELGSAVTPHAVDQTDEAAMRSAISGLVENDAIDGFVNVTGWTRATRFETENSAYWRKVMAINFDGLLYAAQPILRHMIAKKRGKMVFVTSDAGRVGTGNEAVYAAAKGAVIAFAKSLARENARHAINVNCLSPGPTETPLFREEMADHPEIIDRLLKAIPFRRAAKPSDQAAMVRFLLSDDAGYITGQTFSVNGGLTMI